MYTTHQSPTITIEGALHTRSMTAELVLYDIPTPTNTVLSAGPVYLIDMCLTPRPLKTRGCYHQHWGAHRFEALGDIFLVPPGESITVKGGTGRQTALSCSLDPVEFRTLLGTDMKWPVQQLAMTLDITSARIRTLLQRIMEEVRHPGLGSDHLMKAWTRELTVEIARYCIEAHEKPITGGLAGWRLRLIDERLEKDGPAPTLGELAAICNLSTRQMTRGFRVSRGCSIGNYIDRRRIESAKRLLVAGKSIKEIAFATGFSSPSSFAFAFRSAVGTSPSGFRQRQLRDIH